MTGMAELFAFNYRRLGTPVFSRKYLVNLLGQFGENCSILIISKEGKIIRLEAANIRQAGRSTQGVRLVRMEEGEIEVEMDVDLDVDDFDEDEDEGNGDHE